MSSILLGGYYGTHYRVRLYPPFGGIVLYIRNVILLGLTTRKNATHIVFADLPRMSALPAAVRKAPRDMSVGSGTCTLNGKGLGL